MSLGESLSVVDQREALWNDGAIGFAAQIQLARDRITSLRAILFDVDQKILAPGNPLFPPVADARSFLANIRQVLDRHPLARSAEVRGSGTGLHVIIHLDPFVTLDSAVAQEYWDDVVRVVQCTLPGDLNAPGITATTRPVGSINSKNGAKVELLHPGQPIDPKQIEEFVARIVKAPFKEVASVLLGNNRVSPCPICRDEGSRLDVLDHVGMCYGRCGKVNIGQLFDAIFLAVDGKAEKREGIQVKKKSSRRKRSGGK
jgi:hypothetical protein